MPHCLHFPRCNKPDCPYPHVTIHSSIVCKDFAELGWCVKGLECSDRHVKECPEFTEKGTCSNSNCRLPHVINRGQKKKNVGGEEEEEVVESDREEEEDDDGGGDLFFTDVKGKRKASDEGYRRIPPSVDQGRVNGDLIRKKRFKYDQMANNEDFVTFEGSGDEQEEQRLEESSGEEQTGDEENHLEEDEVDSSVDSEELHSDIMVEEQEPMETESNLPSITTTATTKSDQSPTISKPRIRRRSDLELGEEIEEGEIFDDEDDDNPNGDYSESSEDDEEGIVRQLLGDRGPFIRT